MPFATRVDKARLGIYNNRRPAFRTCAPVSRSTATFAPARQKATIPRLGFAEIARIYQIYLFSIRSHRRLRRRTIRPTKRNSTVFDLTQTQSKFPGLVVFRRKNVCPNRWPSHVSLAAGKRKINVTHRCTWFASPFIPRVNADKTFRQKS